MDASQAHALDTSLDASSAQAFGRYLLYAPIARGGMATIHLARLVGDDGFNRIVAAKRLHPHLTEDPEFVAMFRGEAEIASKVHHPNVVPVLDIIVDNDEVVLVQEYVHGVPLDRLFKAAATSREPIPARIVVGILAGVLSGLHAAHETCDETGEPLGIIHRDVSPQNVMVSVDGIPRLLDFGIAKARSSSQETRAGLLKGKVAYMAPEQVRGEGVSRGSDVFACGVMLWELLALRRLHAGRSETEIFSAILHGAIPTLTAALDPVRATIADDRWDSLERLETVVARAVAPQPQSRYATAAEMVDALLRAAPAASSIEIAAWVKARGAEYLERRQQVLASTEESWRSSSRIAVAGGPQSGVTRVRGDAVLTIAGIASEPVAALEPSFTGSLAAVPARISPWVTLVVAAGALLVTGALAGTLLSRRDAPAPAPSAASEAPTHVVEAPVAVATVDVRPVEPAPPPAVVARPVRPAYSPAYVSRKAAVVEAAAPPAARAALAPPPALAPQPAAQAPKVDCDPPFYFEGTKKVFKPNCI